jgi:tRNA A37 methylthiotransferase MiaB
MLKNDNKQKVIVVTNGCPENRLDSFIAQKFFTKNGWPTAVSIEDADLILFNACGQSIQQSLPMIQEIRDTKKKNAELIVYGCLPKTMAQELKKIYQGPTFDSDDFSKLDELFPSKQSSQDIAGNFLIPENILSPSRRFFLHNNLTDFSFLEISRKLLRKLPSYKFKQISKKVNICGEDIFNIKISSGCSSKCTYCSIRFARGKLESKSVNDIIDEFNTGISSGYKKIGLMGTEIANYGADIGLNLPHLLSELIQIDGDYQILLRNLNPHYFLKYLTDLIEIFKSGKIAYLETAVQSGNNRILELMKRGYTVEEYKQAIYRFKEEVPQIKLRTQVMVNFPTETEEEAQDTLNVLKDLKFDFVELYDFRAEPYTLASKMEQVPKSIAQKRYHRMYTKIADLL